MGSLRSQKGLASSDADNESGLYKTVEFRTYCFKVLSCSKRFCHDWTNCPFAHPGEKARRRDPRLFRYKGIPCPEAKKGCVCPRGTTCCYAHNVFEYWLHPNRYRTQPCNDGPKCKRKVCFFAHTLDELRVPNEDDTENTTPGSPIANSFFPESAKENVNQLVQVASSKSLNRSSGHIQPFSHQQRRFLESTRFNVDQPKRYAMSSMTPSMLWHAPNDGYLSPMLDSSTEKPHHLEKALTDLLDEAQLNSPAPLHRIPPESDFNLRNYDTRALESGLHWNGGPAKLFVERRRDFPPSSEESFFGFNDFDTLSNVLAESTAASTWFTNNSPSRQFFFASQLSTF